MAGATEDFAGIGPAGPTALAGGLIRRMVHDLASPLAAVQLLAQEGEPLLAEAAMRLADQLGLYRAIFGGSPDAAIDSALLWSRLAGAVAPARLERDVAAGAPPRAIKAAAALVLGLAGPAQAEDMALRIDDDGIVRLTVTAKTATDEVAAMIAAAVTQTPDPVLAFARQLLGAITTETDESTGRSCVIRAGLLPDRR